MQTVITGCAECERLGESETDCICAIDAATAAGATQGQLRPSQQISRSVL